MRTKFAASMLVLSALLSAPAFAQDKVDANGMPTDHSTPAEQAATANLNSTVAQSNAEISAQDNNNQTKYSIEQQQYQDKLQQNNAAQQQYQEDKASYDAQTARYYALRDRYRDERMHFHRYSWPANWNDWRLKNDGSLVNARVQLINGNDVGVVVGVARTRDLIQGLEVRLDTTGKVVWIDVDDIRFDRSKGRIFTDLYPSDIRTMADERIG